MKAINLELLNAAFKTQIPKTLDGAMDSELMKELLENYEAEKTELLGMTETIRNIHSPRVQNFIMSGIGRIKRDDFYVDLFPIEELSFNEIVEKTMQHLDLLYWGTLKTIYRLNQINGGELSHHARHGYNSEFLAFTPENIKQVLETVESDLNIDHVIQTFKDNLDNIEVIYHKNGDIELVSDTMKTPEYKSKIFVLGNLARSLVRHSHKDWYALLVNSDIFKTDEQNVSGVQFKPNGRRWMRIKLTGVAAKLFHEKFNQN